MKIIPVIDLMQGQVVHAKHGQRQNYQPVQSLLSPGSAPFDVLQALMELYPFTILYIADIDAIQGVGDHFATINKLAAKYSHISFLVDNDIYHVSQVKQYPTNIRPVIGSENITTMSSYQDLSKVLVQPILSLDFKQDVPLGITKLHQEANYWPEDVICMNLNQVGSELGADINQLKNLQQLNSQKATPSRLFAAGGVRNLQDCIQLKAMGITGVLVASALHNGSISAADIALLNG